MNTWFLAVIVAALFVLGGCKKNTESALESTLRLVAEAKEREKTALVRELEERLESEKAQTPNLRRELYPLVKIRKQRLKEEGDKLFSALNAIASNRREFDEAMSAVEDRRGLEYTVFNIMTNSVLNALAVKYTGGDFNALKSEFVEAVRFHNANYKELTQALQKNREEYGNQVAGIDQTVDSANIAAQTSINATHANLQKKIAELEQKKSFLTRLSASDTRNAPGRERRASERPKNAEIHKIDEQLERLYQVLAVTTGSTLHIKATALESGARRKYDTALEGKTAKDAEALKTSQFKGDLYNAVQNYRGRTVDRLLNAMTTQVAILSERLSTAEMTLQNLEDSEARMSLMEYPDLVKLRTAITQDTRLKLEDGLLAPIIVP